MSAEMKQSSKLWFGNLNGTLIIWLGYKHFKNILLINTKFTLRHACVVVKNGQNILFKGKKRANELRTCMS